MTSLVRKLNEGTPDERIVTMAGQNVYCGTKIVFLGYIDFVQGWVPLPTRTKGALQWVSSHWYNENNAPSDAGTRDTSLYNLHDGCWQSHMAEVEIGYDDAGNVRYRTLRVLPWYGSSIADIFTGILQDNAGHLPEHDFLMTVPEYNKTNSVDSEVPACTLNGNGMITEVLYNNLKYDNMKRLTYLAALRKYLYNEQPGVNMTFWRGIRAFVEALDNVHGPGWATSMYQAFVGLVESGVTTWDTIERLIIARLNQAVQEEFISSAEGLLGDYDEDLHKLQAKIESLEAKNEEQYNVIDTLNTERHELLRRIEEITRQLASTIN